MRVVIQRARKASVEINGAEIRSIDHGFVILLGIELEDDQEDIDWLIKKILGLRIFSDKEGKMNLNLSQVNGQILLISQFTLHASTKKGNRPSFIRAAKPDVAIPLYEAFIKKLRSNDVKVETGEFGADMQVSLTNDGPVTIVMDTKNKE